MLIKIVGALLSFTLFFSCSFPIQETTLPFKIKVEFLISDEDILKYPNIAFEYMKAVREWEKHLPMVAEIGSIKKYDENSFLYNNAIKLKIIELNDPELPPNYVGIYYGNVIRITAKAEQNKILAYNVSLHEIGHAMGLRHLFGNSTAEFYSAGTGDFIMNGDAHLKVMYYSESEGTEYVVRVLSADEISVARKTFFVKFGVLR